eukprot:UN25248
MIPNNNEYKTLDDDVDLSWIDAGFDADDKWTDLDNNQWVDTHGGAQMSFADMHINRDGYTGYKGPEAGRVWKAIYAANCFSEVEECKEERTFYRLISGFHTLTTALVFSNFPDENGVFGPSLAFYRKLLHGKNEYVNNLYFGYVFLLRALNKAAPLLQNYPIDTGNPQDDYRAKTNFNKLLNSDFIQSQCTPEFSFDESELFLGDKESWKTDFRTAFRNISTILDCVGCEKCKLHAKIEFH